MAADPEIPFFTVSQVTALEWLSAIRFSSRRELLGHVTAHFPPGLGVDLERAIPLHREEDPAPVVLPLCLSPIRKRQKLLGKTEGIDGGFHVAIAPTGHSPKSCVSQKSKP
jgi:hypothetical protein